MRLRKTSTRSIGLILVALALVISACSGSGTTPPATNIPTLASTPTIPRSTPTAIPSSTPAPTFISTRPPTSVSQTTAPLAPGQNVRWSQTQRGLTAGMFFDPYPPQLGKATTFGVVLTDQNGQPVTDATVGLRISGGMSGMEGEHDEEFDLNLSSQGSGRYLIRASPGSSEMGLNGMTLTIKSGGQVWSFSISKDELTPR